MEIGGKAFDIKIQVAFRGDKLQSVRESRGMSQAELAEAAGVNKRVLQNYEQGKNDINGARLSTIMKLCIALKCGMADILNDPETLELLERYERK